MVEPLGDYITRANDDIICLVMIETVQALENVEEIAKAPEIDGLYIGPSDLSLDMEVPLSGWANDAPLSSAWPTVAFVGTKDFYRPKEESPSGQAYHWNNNAETYYLIGEGMGRAIESNFRVPLRCDTVKVATLKEILTRG